MKGFGVLSFALVGLAAASCDTFPRNAGLTLVENVPTVVFRPCSDDESVRSIAVLRWDGSGKEEVTTKKYGVRR